MEYTSSNPGKGNKYLRRMIVPAILLAFSIIIQLIFNVFGIFFPQDLADVKTPDDKRYVTVTLKDLYPTGYRMVSGGKELGSYYYGFYQGRCIFVVLPVSGDKARTTLSDYKLVGSILKVDEDQSILKKISEDHNLNSASLNNTTYPYIIRHVTSHIVIDMALAVLVVLTMALSAILLVIFLLKAIRYR